MSLEPLAHRKQLTLSYSGRDSLPIQADETRLHRVFLNLLDNGIKHSPEGGVIQVGLQVLPKTPEGREMVRLEVIDQGAGFSEETLPYVFDRFYRADPSRRRENTWLTGTNGGRESGQMLTGGSGLGLAIVRQIVESHGGSVKASNHPKTGGACLEVLLWCKLTESEN
jgi:two-component system phosphate regulon sensor histidine kinase PhoR